MPKAVSEISSGGQFSRSLNQGQLADAATRSFRVILNTPAEAFDIQATCGVFIGDVHPTNANLACTNFDAKYDGDSRTVLLCTFNYASAPAAQGGGGGQQNPKTISPDIRPANWSIGTELTEEPLRRWRRRISATQWQGDGEAAQQWSKPVNPAGDLYEGLSVLRPLTSIKVTQFVLGGSGDPTFACQFVGTVNRDVIQLGSLNIKPHELMLRGINATPTVEPWGRFVLRGWNVEFTFLFKRLTVPVNFDQDGGEWNVETDVDIGWDVPVIVEGRNVIAFNPGAASVWEDYAGQPLKCGSDGNVIVPLSLPDGISPGDRVRACVPIFASSERSYGQAPSSEPIALNANGTARYLVSRKPIVWAYQIYPDIPMVGTLQLRLT